MNIIDPGAALQRKGLAVYCHDKLSGRPYESTSHPVAIPDDAQENPFVLIDPRYRIIAANRAYCNRYGADEIRVVGRACPRNIASLLVPCHLNGETCPHQEVSAQARAQQVLHTHYDHHNRPEHVRIKGHAVFGLNGELFLGEAIYHLRPPPPWIAMRCA